MANPQEPTSINGQTITTSKARPRLGQSAPARWARKQQAAGNCRACGGDRRTPEEISAGVALGQSKLKQLCRGCQNKANAYMSRYRTSKKTPSTGAITVTPTSPSELPSIEPQPSDVVMGTQGHTANEIEAYPEVPTSDKENHNDPDPTAS